MKFYFYNLYCQSYLYFLVYYSPLFLASSAGNEKIIRILFKNGAKIKSNSSDNPIKKVIKMRNVVCLKELLKGEKAAKSIVSETPIMIAIKNNQPEAVRLLIDAGDDPDRKINDFYL